MHDNELCDDLNVSTNALVANNGMVKIEKGFFNNSYCQRAIECCASVISQHPF